MIKTYKNGSFFFEKYDYPISLIYLKKMKLSTRIKINYFKNLFIGYFFYVASIAWVFIPSMREEFCFQYSLGYLSIFFIGYILCVRAEEDYFLSLEILRIDSLLIVFENFENRVDKIIDIIARNGFVKYDFDFEESDKIELLFLIRKRECVVFQNKDLYLKIKENSFFKYKDLM